MSEVKMGSTKYYCKQCQKDVPNHDSRSSSTLRKPECPYCGSIDIIKLVWCRCIDCDCYNEKYHACDACGGVMKKSSKDIWSWCQWFIPNTKIYKKYTKKKEVIIE